LALIALALGIICMVIWGYRMWWLRRPTRPGVRAPVGTQRPRAAAVALVGVVAIAAGVLFPVLGVSVLLFLAVDAARQHLRPAPGQDTGPAPDPGAHPDPELGLTPAGEP